MTLPLPTTDRVTGALSLCDMTINELAKRLCMHRETIARGIERLLDRGKAVCAGKRPGSKNGRWAYVYRLVR
jgi:predicted transcriptional regulator